MADSDTQWPHDPDGETGSEGMRKYGLAIVAKKVDEDEDFPLDVADFVAEYGDDPIRINHDRVVSLAEIFEHVDAATVDDKVTFNQIVGQAMRNGGFWDYAPDA